MSCCSGTSNCCSSTEERDDLQTIIRDGYSEIATSPSNSCCDSGGCCGVTVMNIETLAKKIGYSADELQTILPKGSNLGLGCGNPTAIASLKQGETVLDLGSGAGIDVFISAAKVGKSGHVIGVDMTPAMLQKAKNNAKLSEADNIEFRLGEIEHLPIGDESIDVVLSNCVINLSNDKQQVWNEIYRVLRHGGRLCIEDIELFKPLPESVKELAKAWIGCVAGAELLENTQQKLQEAGFINITIKPHNDYVQSLCEANDPLYVQIKSLLPMDDNDVTKYITSASIVAEKNTK